MRIKRSGSPRLGIIGKVKVGKMEERKGRMIPTSLDHFRVTSNVKQYEKMFEDKYSNQSIIPVMFGTDDDSFNTNHRYEIRNNQGNVYAYGDGENYFISASDGYKQLTPEFIVEKYGTVESFNSKIETYLTKGKYKAEWKEVLTLRFVVAGIPILGAWELRTAAAKSSIDQILGNYDLAKNVNGGTIKGVPFFLRVQKVKSNRVLEYTRVYPVISLDQVLTDAAMNSELLNQGPNINLIDK